jgi:hypothetical protein
MQNQGKLRNLVGKGLLSGSADAASEVEPPNTMPLDTSGHESTEYGRLQLHSAMPAHTLGDCIEEQSIKPPEAGLDQ